MIARIRSLLPRISLRRGLGLALDLVGAGLIVVGAWRVSQTLGLIVAGVALLALAALLETSGKGAA